MDVVKARSILKSVRRVGTFWIAPQTIEHLHNIRSHELDVAIRLMPKTGRLLEIGAGTGWQASQLGKAGYVVSAIDLPSSNYSANRVYEVTEYDGTHIPFADSTFDIIFTSNVLEHVSHPASLQTEVHRVLQPAGVVVHLVPSSSWRFWTNITHLVKNWTVPDVHGEHARNAFAEVRQFSRSTWEKFFIYHGWVILKEGDNGIFYTGCSVFDSRLSVEKRAWLGRWFGSACNVFLLRKAT